MNSFVRSLADSRSLTHGVTTSAATAALTLIDPRRLSVGGRLAYRLSLAALTGWMMWASLRDEQSAPLSPGARAGLVAASIGAVLGFAEAGEAMDARVQDGLSKAGISRPRAVMAAAGGALSLASWWAGRQMPDSAFVPIEDFLDTQEAELPEEVRVLVERLLDGTDGFGAAELRTQLAAARVQATPGSDEFSGEAAFVVPEDVPRAVPGSGEFVVSGRFRALDGLAFDLTLSLHDGRLSALSIWPSSDWPEETIEAWYSADRSPAEIGTWPDAADLTLLVEPPAGRREL